MRMNGSHGSLCIPSRSLKLLKRAVSKVFQFQKLFSLLLRAGAGKTKTKLEYLKMVCMQNSLRITLGWWRPLDFIGWVSEVIFRQKIPQLCSSVR